MSLDDHAIQEKLRSRFCERLSRDLPLLQTYQQQTRLIQDDENKQALIRIAHSLAGAGGTFGFPDISSAAMALETGLRQDHTPQDIDQTLDHLIQVATSTLAA